MYRISLTFSAVMSLVFLPAAAGRAAGETDWFQKAGWGVMTHYLGAPPSTAGGAELTAEAWNRQVDAFDVRGLADQVASTGAIPKSSSAAQMKPRAQPSSWATASSD